MKPIRIVCAAGVVCLAAGIASADHIRKAKANITSCADGSAIGTALLVEVPSNEGVKTVEVIITAQNLTPGSHAVHVHEVGNCAPCSAAGSHLDLGPFGQNVPVTANHPYHSGDLVNLRVGSDGRGSLLATSTRIALAPGNLSIFDADGSAIVIHALADQYCTDPTDPNCAGGGRAACGILQPTN
ncbi:MAG TPA: superoxide dismutase family protein [Vicinamibacteria bacterium]|nr:superoxide dismutase family protein [Vicinamibacteria bacterium]